MTGYGSGSQENEDYKVAAEIKTLNSKFLDLNLRSPRILNSKEPDIRNMITRSLIRGKVNLNIEIEHKNEEVGGKLYNEVLFKKYYKELKDLARSVGAPEDQIIQMVLQQPDVTKGKNIEEIPEKLWVLVEQCLENAIQNCRQFREKEGKDLEGYLAGHCMNIEKSRLEISKIESGRSQKIRERIEQNLEQFLGDQELIDQNRLEQEIIFYIEKLDIHEELDRLSTHVRHYQKVLTKEENNGKKLGFIAQEMGREINTIGSKANDAEMQRFVISMKEDLEKIKEQVLNIL